VFSQNEEDFSNFRLPYLRSIKLSKERNVKEALINNVQNQVIAIRQKALDK